MALRATTEINSQATSAGNNGVPKPAVNITPDYLWRIIKIHP